MALGIGASVALFAVVRGVLLKPLLFKDSDRLMMVYERGTGGDIQSNPFNIVPRDVCGMEEKQNRSFSDLALVGYNGSNLSGDGRTTSGLLQSATCTWNLLRTLGASPALGRDFAASDDQPSANGTCF